MKNEKVFVLIHDDVEYNRFQVCGVYSEESKQLEMQKFIYKERCLNESLINDCYQYIEAYKRRRADITTADTRLLSAAGKHLTTSEIREHERNMKEIEEITAKIADRNALIEKLKNYSDIDLAENCMKRMHLIFQEFEIE